MSSGDELQCFGRHMPSCSGATLASCCSLPTQEEAVGSDGPCVSASPPRAPRWWSLTSARSQPTRPWGACRVTSGDRVTWRPWWMCRQKRVWRSWSQASRCVAETEETPHHTLSVHQSHNVHHFQRNTYVLLPWLHVRMLPGLLHAFFFPLFLFCWQ